MKTLPRWTLVAALALFALPGHADAPPGRFVVSGNTVTDTMTQLEWQRADDNVVRSWASALTYCSGLTLGGNSDWRLPTVKELQTLVDHERTIPSMDPVFTGADSEAYWSATPLSGSASNAWCVIFFYGNADNYNVGSTYRARCVR